MNHTAYTKEQVYQVFKREAILIGHADAVPAKRAALYFSKAALDFANRVGQLKAKGAYGIGDRCSCYEYFTLYGLELAATYDNISTLLDEETTA